MPKGDREDKLRHCGKMIDDVISYGYTEEYATAEVGDINEVVVNILSGYPLLKLIKERIKRILKNMKPREVSILCLLSPIWLSLLIAGIAVVLSLYLIVCAGVVSMWVVSTSLEIISLIGTAAGVVLLIWRNIPQGLAVIGIGLIGVGVSVLIFFCARALTKGLRVLTQKTIFHIKQRLIKENEYKRCSGSKREHCY